MKYAKTEQISQKEQGPMQEVTYLDACDVPKVLFAIFCCQKDEVRVDAAELVLKYKDKSDDMQLMDHIIDQIWVQYDYGKSGVLDETESYDFLSVVLQLNENMLAKSCGREI